MHPRQPYRLDQIAVAAWARLLCRIDQNPRVDDIFPISYDIRPYCLGHSEVLLGMIDKEPSEKLSGSETVALALAK